MYHRSIQAPWQHILLAEPGCVKPAGMLSFGGMKSGADKVSSGGVWAETGTAAIRNDRTSATTKRHISKASRPSVADATTGS